MSEVREECGISAIALRKKDRVMYSLYKSLIAIQHRGQNAAGIVMHNGEKLDRKVGLGLVREVFDEKDLEKQGTLAIGHTRYPTTGRCKIQDVQPVQYEKIAVCHNGHVSNYKDLRKEYEEKGYKFQGTVDVEPFLYIVDDELKKNKNIEQVIEALMKKVVGSYSVVGIVDGVLVVFRDPHAIRPLIYGKNGDDLCFCSESVALDINGFEYVGEVKGGELLLVKEGKIEKKRIIEKEQRNCMFEYVYFSRPDSMINDVLVNDVRKKLGETLAEEQPVKAEVVVPIPDTSRTAALAFAEKLNIKYEEGFIKNRYIGRTFIMMDQKERREAVKRKINPIKSVMNGKRVVIVDDSIVRGTTMREIIKMIRGVGAKEVHLRITCPPIKAPCFYGVDMPTFKELIASNRSIEEIRKYLDVDSLGYSSIKGLKKVLGDNICTGCLNEDYFSEYVKKMAKEEKRR